MESNTEEYERDSSHYHCWDTTEGDEGINGQKGHEKHLACCICRKRPEEVRLFGNNIREAIETVKDFIKPESKTSDEVERIAKIFESYIGEDVIEGTDFSFEMRSTLTALVARVREGALKEGKTVGDAREFENGKKEGFAAGVKSYDEEARKEGALAVLADLEAGIWQPIETAPKTGEHIFVKSSDSFGICGGKEQSFADVVHYWDFGGEEGFYASNGEDTPYKNLTHWMPIDISAIIASLRASIEGKI